MNTEEKLARLLDYQDPNGKRLIYKPEEGGKVYIEIDEQVKCIGTILIGKNNILYTKFDDEKNIFRKTNSWSINQTLLTYVDIIHIETRLVDYRITKERALEFGQYFHFQDTTELKVYVPLEYWETRKKGLKDLYPEEFKFRNYVGDSWYPVLKDTLHSPMMDQIRGYLKQRRKEVQVYPDSDRVFRAFQKTSFEHTKVVILGQDPYYDGSASGLAFGYLEGSKKKHSKSLDLIFQEIENDEYNGLKLERDYSLEDWAKQGVLLLNTALTVEKNKALSHAKTATSGGIGWERFTKIVIWKLIQNERPKVFLLWGAKAKEHIKDVLDKCSADKVSQHLFLYSPHPASDLYKQGHLGNFTADYPNTFLGCKHFSRANRFLSEHNRKQIKW